MLKLASKSCLLACILALSSVLCLNAHAATYSIVGTWYASFDEGRSTLTFNADGTYIDDSVVYGDPAHTGIESGTYTWNSTTGAIYATATVDNNGDWGFASDPNGLQYFTVLSETTAVITQVDCEDCTIYLTRVAAVPEPEFDAMLLLGLGLVGFASRSKKNAA